MSVGERSIAMEEDRWNDIAIVLREYQRIYAEWKGFGEDLAIEDLLRKIES